MSARSARPVLNICTDGNKNNTGPSGRRRARRRRRAVGCTPRPEGPGPAAEKFFRALAVGDTATAAQLSDNPNEAREALNAAWAGLQATHLDAQILSSKYAEDTGTVNYRFTWHLPKNRKWSYDGQLKMARDEGHWQVRWVTTELHPRLGEHQTFALRADQPRRASVNELGGSDVLAPGYLYHYTLDATQAGPALIETAHAVIDALHPFNDTLNDPQLLAEKASSSADALDLGVTLQPADNDKVFPAIGRLPGVVVAPQADMLPTDPHFAPAVVAEVKKSVINQLDGQAGWRIVSVNQNNVDVAVLHEVEGSPAPSVSITLDRVVQNAAQHAVDTRGGKAMIVVDQAVDRGDPGDRAERGRRQPGSGRHHRPVPARVDVQDGHGRRRRRPRHGHARTRCWAAPATSTSGTAPSPTTAASISAWCRCHARSPVRATPRSPSWAAGCRPAA